MDSYFNNKSLLIDVYFQAINYTFITKIYQKVKNLNYENGYHYPVITLFERFMTASRGRNCCVLLFSRFSNLALSLYSPDFFVCVYPPWDFSANCSKRLWGSGCCKNYFSCSIVLRGSRNYLLLSIIKISNFTIIALLSSVGYKVPMKVTVMLCKTCNTRTYRQTNRLFSFSSHPLLMSSIDA